MKWIEYHLKFPHETDTESVMYILHEYGFINSWEDRPVEIIEIPDGYDYAVKDSDVEVVTYIEMQNEEGKAAADRLVQSLSNDLALFKPKSIVWKEAERVTGNEWREHFPPQTVSDQLVILPIWEQEEAERYDQKYKLFIEPGAAFGTGNHGTTQSCLRMIEHVGVQGKSILDIGAGSGILSVYCKMLGASDVVAVDINPSSPSEIEYLSELNKVGGIHVIVTDGNDFATTQQFDIVLFNIGGEEAVRQADHCKRILKPQGKLILSGIVKWAEPDVVNTYGKLGFVLDDRHIDEEWITMLMQV